MPARHRVLASTMGLPPVLGACFAAVVLWGPVGEALSCRGASGRSTDWFVALKAAASEYGVPGTSYAYLDRCVRAYCTPCSVCTLAAALVPLMGDPKASMTRDDAIGLRGWRLGSMHAALNSSLIFTCIVQ